MVVHRSFFFLINTALCLFLTACSSVKCYFPGGCWGQDSDNGNPLVLSVGDTHTMIHQGFSFLPARSMWWGLIASKPGVVDVVYTDDKTTQIRAVSPGEVRLYVVNRYVFPGRVFLEDLDTQDRQEYFRGQEGILVRVREKSVSE